MVDVLQCGADGGKLHRIDSVKANPQVAHGDRYEIIVTHSTDAWINQAYCRLSLWDSNTLIAESGSIVVKPRESVITKFTGIMPNNDLYLNVSLQAEIFGFIEECQDGKELYIKLAPPGEFTEPIDIDEPEEEDDETIMDWIMDNIVLILMLVLVIILLIKFG